MASITTDLVTGSMLFGFICNTIHLDECRIREKIKEGREKERR